MEVKDSTKIGDSIAMEESVEREKGRGGFT